MPVNRYNLFIIHLCLAFCLLATQFANAKSLLLIQRAQFIKAERLLKAGKKSEYRVLRQKLKSYPLAPYLDYKEILLNFKSTRSSQIANFIDKYPDLPIANRLNRAWLKFLVRKKYWKSYIKHFSAYPINETFYICNQQNALLQGSKKQHKMALQQAPKLWMVGNSQPKACDPLFAAWKKTGHPNSSQAFQRFQLSLKEGNIDLARYLDKLIYNQEYKKQTALFWSLYNKPEKVAGSLPKKLDDSYRLAAIKLAYKRWFQKDPQAATKDWAKRRSQLIPLEKQEDITTHMGVRLNLGYKDYAKKLSALLDPDYKIDKLTQRRIRTALAHQDWQEVKRAITHLSPATKDESVWQYWNLIADRHISTSADQKEQITKLAQKRDFYGFLAATLINSPFKLNAESDIVTPESLKKLAAKPAVARAHELFKLDRLISANREWRLALSNMNSQEQKIAGYLANSWGWHLQAIINAAKTERWNHIKLRFPQPYTSLFHTQAANHGLDANFPIAIARQESAFLATARSRVGARGLMQLMPRTAKQTAKKHDIPYKKRSELFQPNLNIKLGTAYLSDMLKRFDNNPAYAAAAYNAGPHRVSAWLKQRGNLPLDVWIETIPFSETRNYVQNVLSFKVIYDQLQGLKKPMLSPTQIKQLALNQSHKTKFRVYTE